MQAAAGTAAGLPGLVVTMIPSVKVGNALGLMAGPNHDIIYYTFVSNYLYGNGWHRVPHAGEIVGATAPPATYTAMQSLTLPLRIGAELVLAVWRTLTGMVASTSAVSGLLVAIVMVAGVTMAVLLVMRRPWWTAVGAALMVSSAATLTTQVYAQNLASLWGVPLAMLAMTAFASTVGNGPDRLPFGASRAGPARTARAAHLKRRPAVPTSARPPENASLIAIPCWFAGLCLAGLVAVYIELLPMTVLSVVIGTLPALWRWKLRGLLAPIASVAWSLLLNPFGWWIAVRSTMAISSLTDNQLLTYYPNALVAVNEMAGISPLGIAQPAASLSTYAVVAVIAFGLVAASVFGPARALWAGLVVAFAALVARMVLISYGYSLLRVIQTGMPVVLLAVAVGLASVASFGLRWWQRAPLVLAVSLSMLGVSAVNLMAAYKWTAFRAPRQTIIEAREATGWVHQVADQRGSNIMVIVPDLPDQLWTMDGLFDLPDVEYSLLEQSYATARYTDWVADDRYVLVGAGAFVAGDESAVISSNRRFKLIDMTKGKVVVAAPNEERLWSHFNNGTMTANVPASVKVLRSPSAPTSATVTLGVAPSPFTQQIRVRYGDPHRGGPVIKGAPTFKLGITMRPEQYTTGLWLEPAKESETARAILTPGSFVMELKGVELGR